MMNVKKQTKKPIRKRVDSPFKDNLSSLLKERGISQRGAAEIMGVSVAVVNDWLQGAYPNDQSAVLKFCKAVKCDFQWLLTGEQSQGEDSRTNLSEIFDIQNEPAFSGIFMVEAKRLKKREDK